MSVWIWLVPLALLAWLMLRNRGASQADLSALAARNPQRVDVRTPGEYRAGHAPGAVNIPLDQLPGRLSELDRGRPVVLCCATGSRSAAAASLLRQAGFEALNAGSWRRLLELP